MIKRWLGIAVCLCAALASVGRAQEVVKETTDAERSWRDLRGSDDVKSKLMADRWYGVVKQQEWSDKSGKFKTSAKYLAHDPKLEWVKLRVIQGTGAERVVKDVQIPLEKLSPVCQSRVRQIAALSEKVAAAVEEEKKSKEDENKDGGATEIAADRPRGRGATDGGSADGDEADEKAEAIAADRKRRRERLKRGAAQPKATAGETEGSESTAESAPIANHRHPLPPLQPKRRSAVADAEAAGPESSNPAAIDPANWRTSYEAFRANLAPPSGMLQNMKFGAMNELEVAHETMMRCESDGDVDDADLQEMNRSLAAVGEVTWEATVAGAPDPGGDWSDALGLARPPEPIGIGLLLDTDHDIAGWKNLKVGDRVRFVGRFVAFDDEYSMVLAIRMAGEQPASAAP